MKLTKQQLKQIIMEELEATLNEKTWAPTPPGSYEGDVKAAQRRARDTVRMQDLKSRSSFADPSGKAAAPRPRPKDQPLPGGIELAADTTTPGFVRTAQKAADIADTSISTAGPLAKGLGHTAARALPGVGLVGGANAIRNALGDTDAAGRPRGSSLAQKAARVGSEIALGAGDLATMAPKLAARTVGKGAARALTNPLVGAVYAGYEGGKALQQPLAKAGKDVPLPSFLQKLTGREKGIVPDLGRTVGITDIDYRPSAIKGAFTGGDHTGGTQVDLSTRTDASCKRRGPKGKCLDAPSSTTPKPTPSLTTPKPSDLVGKRDDEDDIPKPGKNLAEAWGFSMDLDKLNESTSGHVTPAKD